MADGHSLVISAGGGCRQTSRPCSKLVGLVEVSCREFGGQMSVSFWGRRDPYCDFDIDCWDHEALVVAP